MNRFEAVIGARLSNEIVWSFLVLNKDNKNKVVLFSSLIPPLEVEVRLALPCQVAWSGPPLAPWQAHLHSPLSMCVGTSGLTSSWTYQEALNRPRRRWVRATMSNRNYRSCLAHGFYLQCQVGVGATVNKCSYLSGPAQPSGTHTGSSLTGSSLAEHPRPGFVSLPKARGEAREAAQGEQELLCMAVGKSVTAPRHTPTGQKRTVCLISLLP